MRRLYLGLVRVPPAMPLMRQTPAKVMLCLLPWLTGCLVHTHKVQKARIPTVLREATADQLVEIINHESASIQSLNASVDFQASVGGEHKGSITDYTSLSGFILLRKPEAVHVVGLVPVLRTRAFELASDGKTFQLLIPSQNKLVEGTNAVRKASPKALENLRPAIFFNSLIPRRISPDELVTRTATELTSEDPTTHQRITLPEYELTIVRRKQNSQELIPERVIHFSRVDLQPFQEDSYDGAGAIETEAAFGPSVNFGGMQYPKTVTIKRPLEEYQIVITIDKLAVNDNLTDAQFELKVPEGVQVQRLP